MKRALVLIAISFALCASVAPAAVNQSIGVSADAWLAAQNGGSNSTDFYVGKDVYGQSYGKMANTDLTLMFNGNANAGKGGTAKVDLNSLTMTSQTVGPKDVIQSVGAGLDLWTLASKNGSSFASFAECVDLTGTNNNTIAVDSMMIVGTSATVVMPSFCAPPGSAANKVSLNIAECQTVTGGGCK